MRINNNLMAMNTHRQLGVANTGGAKSMEKLSSGFRINRAGDDAAGLAISEKMRGQIRGLSQASANAQDGISLIQTAEGALNETHAILQRMRELAVQSSTDTNTDADRGEIQKEVNQLSEEITRIADTTQFNTMNLLDGSYNNKKFHIGANSDQNTTINIGDMGSASLKVDGSAKEAVASEGTVEGVVIEAEDGKTYSVNFINPGADNSTLSVDIDADKNIINVTLVTNGAGDITSTQALVAAAIDAKDGFTASATTDDTVVGAVTGTVTGGSEAIAASDGAGINVSTQGAANSSITVINKALETVSSERSKLGAMQNRLEHTIKNLDTSAENLQASEARIRDVDMAKEMMEQTKQNILAQASTAMLAQANQAPQAVLQLLR